VADMADSEGRKIFVGGIPFGVDKEGIREDFGQYGEIEDVYLPTDRETNKLRGFGFVTFRDPHAASEASKNMHG
jgi:RNA recognition motif-containing protein